MSLQQWPLPLFSTGDSSNAQHTNDKEKGPPPPHKETAWERERRDSLTEAKQGRDCGSWKDG